MTFLERQNYSGGKSVIAMGRDGGRNDFKDK